MQGLARKFDPVIKKHRLQRSQLTTSSDPGPNVSTFVPDSPAAWRRLLIALAIGTVGTVGMWSVVVVLPNVHRRRRRGHGPPDGPSRHHSGDGDGHAVPAVRLSRRRHVDGVVAIRRRVFVHRTWRIGDLRAADGGSLALVRSPARDRGGDRRQRLLSFRRPLAGAHR